MRMRREESVLAVHWRGDGGFTRGGSRKDGAGWTNPGCTGNSSKGPFDGLQAGLGNQE